MSGVTYSDGITLGSTFTYDRLGRALLTSQAGHSWAYAYDPSTLLPDTETITYDTDGNGTGDFTRVIDRSFDGLRRWNGWALKTGTVSELTHGIGYETVASRVESVTGGGDVFQYSYKPSAPHLLQNTTAVIGDELAFTVQNIWESNRDVLDRKENLLSGNRISWYDYTVNAMGRRTNVQQQGTAYPGNAAVDWGYNGRGEVTLHNHSNDTHDRVFELDGIGNRKKGATGTVLPGSDDTASNALNQYTSIVGFTQGYDFDGNLTADGGANPSAVPRSYQWDGQNQLRQVSLTSGGTIVAEFRYDPSGRRISKTGSGITTWYVYDGWNLIAEYQSGALQRKHVWGLDLSGTAQGAGGVGGLLCTYLGSSRYYPIYDGNGNICQYLDSAGAVAAKYEYGPFGYLQGWSGSAAGALTFRFSTKYVDGETGDYYYGYRYYSSWRGRWLSRDPMGERGGTNLYGMVRNNPVNRVDVLGHFEYPPSYPGYYPEPSDPNNPPIPSRPSDLEHFGGGVTVDVYECEIVLLYGHGNGSKPHKFDFKGRDCAAGKGFFWGCEAYGTNEKIPSGNKLFPDENGSLGDSSKTEAQTELFRRQQEIDGIAKEMTKPPRCCTRVNIRHVQADYWLGITDWFQSYDDFDEGWDTRDGRRYPGDRVINQ